jgi:hypothetical protein
MMFDYLAVSLVLTLTSAADYDSCPKVDLFYGIFSSFSQYQFLLALAFQIFHKTLSTVEVRHRF